ncbi:MAG TPA: GNAT family N-acetyltransferase [Anaerolineales bacterium]
MNPSDFKISPFEAGNATQEEFSALNRHTNRIRLERLPDDPPIPLEESIQNLKNIPPYVDLRQWAVWNPDQTEITGYANVAFLKMEENKHLAQFEITVLSGSRRQGLGRHLLSLIAEAARKEARRLLITSSTDRILAGEAFLLRIGAQKGLEGHTNQLRLVDLDRNLISRWLERGQGNSANFELGFWDGPYPEDKIQQVADLYEVTNQQPFGDLEVEDMHMTPEHLRQTEKNNLARGNQRWTFYIIDRATGKFAGYTETIWNPNRPELLRQDMTGVLPQYRNLGLGRWLKAAMLDKVLRERFLVKYVRTGNADVNAAMLKINHELGFKPYTADALWQVELQKVLDYLNSSAK